MKTNWLRRTGVVVAAFGTLVGTAAVAHAGPAVQLTQVGATAIVYKGPQIQVVVSDRFARYNPEGKWLLLDTAMTATSNPVEIPRSAIAVRTPDGSVVPLATQAEFEMHYPELASTLMRARVAREPLDYLIPQRPRFLRLFAPRGIGIVWDSAWLDQFHNSYGRLYFNLPNGVQKGRYELLIRLPKDEVVIPFTV
ncbi:MAG: hypothetical protein PHQ91_11700 [Thermoanaerobaculaceae bacterium]|nr:hypothetical protein [Thermoanaerobaculaceae bacterium]TAM45751.1 MAG: hypothetical protein EPN53_14420 [Acidobacteriota bacterium]